MVRLTKAQKKRLVTSLKDKADKLYMQASPVILSMKDYDAIRSICDRVLKKID